MGELSRERMERFKGISHKYFDWNIVLRDANIPIEQDLDDQLVIKCFRHPDKRPSCRILLKQHYCHCFSCGFGGKIVDVMFELSHTSLSKSQYFDQLLKASPGMRQELGFSSLFIDSKSLDPAFNTRRKFSAKNHIGAAMPISVLSDKVRKNCGDTWENLVFTLTLLQEGETTDAVYARVSKACNTERSDKKDSVGVISLTSLLEE